MEVQNRIKMIDEIVEVLVKYNATLSELEFLGHLVKERIKIAPLRPRTDPPPEADV